MLQQEDWRNSLVSPPQTGFHPVICRQRVASNSLELWMKLQMPEFGQSFMFLLSAKVPKALGCRYWRIRCNCVPILTSFIVHYPKFLEICTFEKEISLFWFWLGDLLLAWGGLLFCGVFLFEEMQFSYSNTQNVKHTYFLYMSMIFFFSCFFKAGMTKG